MANRSVIDIDVNDQQFKQFYELYKDFSDKLEEMPASWKTLNEGAAKAQEAMAAGFGAMTEHMARLSGGVQDMSKHLRDAKALQKQFGDLTGTSERSMKRLAHAAKEVRDTLFGIGGFLTKIGVAGLGLFTGATFGLDKLAQSAVGTQRTARGLGMTPGQLKAFQTDFGLRYMDEGTLGSIVNARSDMVGNVWMRRALGGISGAGLNSMDAGELAAKLAIKAHDWWMHTPEAQRNTAFYQTTGLGQSGIPFQLARQYGNTDRTELLLALTQYRRDAASLNVNNGQVNGLYSFERQLKLAGSDLETYLSRKLAALGPHLGGFLTTLERDGKKLLDEVLTPQNLDRVGKGLDAIATYLGSGDFLTTMKEAGHDIKAFLSMLGGAATWIAKAFHLDTPGSGKEPSLADVANSPAFAANPKKSAIAEWAASHYAADMNGTGIAKPGSVADKFFHSVANMYGMQDNAILTNAKHAYVNKGNASALFGKLEAAAGLPKGTLYALAANESSFDANAMSAKGAQGLFQLMPGVSKALGIENPRDWRQNTLGAVTLMGQLQTRYHGDLRKELAAWNWNPSSVDSDIKKHGADWMTFLPDETKVFMSRVLKTMMEQDPSMARKKGGSSMDAGAQVVMPGGKTASIGRSGNVNIRIFNQAGSNVAVSTNAGAVA